MKIVFVGGFFDPVHKALENAFAAQMKAGSIIWIRQAGIGRELNINEFKSRLFDSLAKGAREVLIVLAVLRGKEWVEERVRSLIESAQQIYPDVEIQFRAEKNAQDSAAVLSRISTYGVSIPPAVPLERLGERLQGKRVLCVGLDGHTEFEEGLKRLGFAADAFASHFVELRIPRGKNSNLIEVLEGKSKSFDHLLYAWSGLRTLPPATKRRFTAGAFEAASVFEVLLLFKRWVLGVNLDPSDKD